MVGASTTPGSHKGMTSQNKVAPGRTSYDRDGGGGGGGGLQPPATVAAASASGRNMSSSALRSGGSFNPSFAPGSFSSELRSQMGSRAGARADLGGAGYAGSIMNKVDEDGTDAAAEQAIAMLKDRLNRELKIKEGSENMLEALHAKKAKQTKEQRQRVEVELLASNARIKELRQQIADAQQSRTIAPAPTTPTRNRERERDRERERMERERETNAGLRSPPSAARSDAASDVDDSPESPTFALAELLQALEVEGMTPEYYVSRANQLVDLFKRHPTLKYDLVWSVFGLRMQVMLLSESREVVAAGYRMTRYAISDRASLRKIRNLNTDYIAIRYVLECTHSWSLKAAER